MFEWARLLFSKPPPQTPLTTYTQWDRFGVATILDRLLVPLLLVPLVVSGELSPQLGVPFAVLDPALAIVAWIIFARTRSRSASAAIPGH